MEIAVTEGATVLPGQVLLRLDPGLQEAETRALQGELAQHTLQLRRIDAELADRPLLRQAGDPGEMFARADAQFRANRNSYLDALAQETSAVSRTTQDLRAALAVLNKLQRTVPIYQTMAQRYATLQAEGYVSELFALERKRDLIEKEQDLTAQEHTLESLRANLAQAERRLAQVSSTYQQQLHNERAQAAGQRGRAEEELAKQLHRAQGVELRAPEAGVVKDLATHTIGTVVSPGTVLLTLVPVGENLQVDVLVRHIDAGFVRVGQKARIKLASYPFQKYGLLEGTVVHVSADASESPPSRRDGTEDDSTSSAPSGYRARIDFPSQSVAFDGHALPLASGMQAVAEIRLGVPDQRRGVRRTSGGILRPVDESQQVPGIEIPEAGDVVLHRHPLPDRGHDLPAQLERQVAAVGPDVEQHVTGSRRRVMDRAGDRPQLVQPGGSRGTCGPDAIPVRRPEPDNARQLGRCLTESNRPNQRVDIRDGVTHLFGRPRPIVDADHEEHRGPPEREQHRLGFGAVGRLL